MANLINYTHVPSWADSGTTAYLKFESAAF